MGSIYKQRNGKWRISWTDGGERESAVFTKQKDAERGLRERERAVEEVALGIRVAIDVDKLFDDVIEHWETYRMPQKRSSGDDASIIKGHLKPAFLGVKLRELHDGNTLIEDFRKTLAHLNDKTVLNILTLLGSMLRVAVRKKWLAARPHSSWRPASSRRRSASASGTTSPSTGCGTRSRRRGSRRVATSSSSRNVKREKAPAAGQDLKPSMKAMY